jgi:hypothetical protein
VTDPFSTRQGEIYRDTIYVNFNSLILLIHLISKKLASNYTTVKQGHYIFERLFVFHKTSDVCGIKSPYVSQQNCKV